MLRFDRIRSVGAACAAALLAVALPRAAAALPLISEVLYDAVGSDNGQVFVELYGTPGASLLGLVLEGVNGANGSVGPSLMLGGVFPADGLFVIADDLGDGTTLVAGADWIADFDFQNGPDSIVLLGPGGVLDAVGYGVFGPGEIFAGEGQPAPDPPAGSSLARRFANLDSDDNLADFVPLDLPTPGAAALASLPEPGTAVLMAAVGALLLAAGGRRRAIRG